MKTYYCRYCGEELYGQKTAFCSKKCGGAWQGDQYKMDYGMGWAHNDPVSPEQRQYTGTIEPLHVPYEILEQAKVYTDCTLGGYSHPLGYKFVEDYEEINQAMHILQHYPKKYRKVKSDDKQLEKHVPGISRKDFN